MPTYLCVAPEGRLSDQQKASLAQAITRAHSEETAAPTYLVQVFFQAFKPADHFVGGAPGPRDHVWIRGDLRAGRTEAALARLQLRLVREVSAIAGLSPDDVWVYLNELQPSNMVEFGHLLPKPGDEAEWFRGLPAHLQARLGPR